MSDDPASRRSEARERTLIEIEYGTSEEFISDFALNISKGGMFISTSTPLNEGSEFDLRFSLPDSAVPIRLRAKVMWVNKSENKNQLIAGMGVAFLDLDQEKRRTIEKYIDSLNDAAKGARR